MFNTSLETSQFPDSWKVAGVTPIFKGGEKTEKSNYRPISVLPVISKLFDKLVFDQLYQYMTKNDLFSHNQSGFRRLHSTLTCLLKNTDDWYSGMELGQLVGLVFIDFKKAFDSVKNSNLWCSTERAVIPIHAKTILQGKSCLFRSRECRSRSATRFMSWPCFFTFISMIYHWLSGVLLCPCMLTTPVCAIRQ